MDRSQQRIWILKLRMTAVAFCAVVFFVGIAPIGKNGSSKANGQVTVFEMKQGQGAMTLAKNLYGSICYWHEVVDHNPAYFRKNRLLPKNTKLKYNPYALISPKSIKCQGPLPKAKDLSDLYVYIDASKISKTSKTTLHARNKATKAASKKRVVDAVSQPKNDPVAYTAPPTVAVAREESIVEHDKTKAVASTTKQIDTELGNPLSTELASEPAKKTPEAEPTMRLLTTTPLSMAMATVENTEKSIEQPVSKPRSALLTPSADPREIVVLVTNSIDGEKRETYPAIEIETDGIASWGNFYELAIPETQKMTELATRVAWNRTDTTRQKPNVGTLKSTKPSLEKHPSEHEDPASVIGQYRLETL